MKVLVFEADADFAGVLQDGLSRIGCQTTLVDDANVGLQAAASDKPDLILLSIELPRMNGFSVCNKLKRDPALKDVPLIIMSSDSTEETFEQHRRLRTRAEDYVHKPITFPDLVTRAKSFVSLPDVGSEPPPSSDIVIDDEIVLEDADSLPDASLSDAGVDNEQTTMMDNPLAGQNLEGDVSAFADSAFNALQANPSLARGSRPDREPEIPRPPKTPSELPRAKSEPPQPEKAASVPPPLARRRDTIPPRPAGDGAAYQAEIERHRGRAAELEMELRGVKERLAAFEDSSKLDALKDAEVQRLKRDLDEAKAKIGSASKGGSSAREFLDLREQLNKKDKELLELREQVTAKERDLLGLRDQSLGFERQKADLNDKLLELENQIYDAQRAIESLRADKEQAHKRGDDFKRKGEKLQTELDIRTQELEDARQAHANESRARDAREAEMRAEHAAALEQAEAKRQADVAAAEEQGRENLARAVDETKREAAEDKAKALAEAIAQAAVEKDEALAGRESELRKEFDSRLAALHRANEDAMNKLKAEHAQTLQEAEEAAAKRLADREAQMRAEHDATKAELAVTRQELADVREAKEEGEASRDARIAALAADLHERTEERDSARETITTRDSRIAYLEEELAREKAEHSTARDTIAARDFSIAGLEDNLAKIRDELERTKQALERENARLEKARGKWESDRGSLERTKDALAAALAQIEEAENRSFD